jgi:hypothetical protein
LLNRRLKVELQAAGRQICIASIDLRSINGDGSGAANTEACWEAHWETSLRPGKLQIETPSILQPTKNSTCASRLPRPAPQPSAVVIQLIDKEQLNTDDHTSAVIAERLRHRHPTPRIHVGGHLRTLTVTSHSSYRSSHNTKNLQRSSSKPLQPIQSNHRGNIQADRAA